MNHYSHRWLNNIAKNIIIPIFFNIQSEYLCICSQKAIIFHQINNYFDQMVNVKNNEIYTASSYEHYEELYFNYFYSYAIYNIKR